MIKHRYRRIYRQVRYDRLINSLSQRNRYRYAYLYREEPPFTGRHARHIKVPEGHLLLARTTHTHAPELIDLRIKPLQLHFHILTFDHTRQRIRLQISKQLWRQKLAYVSEVCGTEYWRRHEDGAGPRKAIKQVLSVVNGVSREMLAIDRHAFVYPDTRRAWDKKVRQLVMTWLVSVARIKLNEAKLLVRRELISWYRSRDHKRTDKNTTRPQLEAI